LLPSGKFPRFALFAAILAALVLIYDLEFVHQLFTRLLLSNCLDAAAMLLAAACCFYVAVRSSGYVRQVWFLLAIAISMEFIGQGLSTYYQSFVPNSSLAPEPSDLFFFAWAAPVFMILLPRSDEQSSSFDPLRLLDFLQIAIVAVTAYLYFFYFTERWKSDQLYLVRGILWIYIVRDLLLSVGFFFRSRSSVPSWFRRFAVVLTLAFLLQVATHADYLVTLAATAGDASWGDLLAMLPYTVIVGFGVFWREPEPERIPAATSRADNLFTTQFFPLVMPLLVIFMARAIAPEHALLAWLTLGASVFCSSIRLILTNRRQRRVSADLLTTEKALHSSQELLSLAFYNSPDGFSISGFPNGEYVQVNDGFTRLTGYTREESIGKSPVELKLWVYPPSRKFILDELRENGLIRNFEMQFRTKTGQFRDGLLSGTLVNLDGRQHAIICVRDVTEIKIAEAAIRTSEERFRSLVNNLHVGIVSCDCHGSVTFANQAILNLLALSREQLIGKPIYDLGLTAYREDGTPVSESERPVSTVLRTQKPLLNQVLGYRRPGYPEIGWTVIDVVPEFSHSGELVGMLISLTDITEQRRATDALRESEERFRTLVSNLQAAVVLHGLDGTLEYVNPAAMRMLKLPEDTEVQGKLHSDFGVVTLDENGKELAGDDRPVYRVLRTHLPVPNVNVGFRHPLSQEILWVFGSSVPRFDAHGNFRGVITSFTDLTEQRRASDALRESEERFRTLVRDLHVGVVLHNPDATVQFANRAALNMFGRAADQLQGKNVGGLSWTPIDVNGRVIPFDKLPAEIVIRTKLPVRNNVIGWRHADSKETLWIFGNAVPQYAPDGSILRVITSFSDITEMKNAERSIHQLSTELLKLQDEERRRIGRELHDGMAQTVLAVNLSLAQLRQSGQPLTDASKRALDKARELLQQMSREIRTLSYLLHPPLLDDLGLVTALKEYVNGFSERSGIETTLELPSRFRRLPQMVETAFFRITQESLSNIQRHSGSKVAKVSLREDLESVTLEITDYGHGMASGNGEPLRPPRLGVGIPGMRERMAQLGGYLDIESDSHGTTVRARMLLSAPALNEALHESSSTIHRG